MKRTVTFTHKGWFGLCPVYFAELGEEKDDFGGVEARHWSLEWLFDLSEILFGMLFFILGFFRADIELSWPFLITGELAEPITHEWEDE